MSLFILDFDTNTENIIPSCTEVPSLCHLLVYGILVLWLGGVLTIPHQGEDERSIYIVEIYFFVALAWLACTLCCSLILVCFFFQLSLRHNEKNNCRYKYFSESISNHQLKTP